MITTSNSQALDAYTKTSHPGGRISPEMRERLILEYAPLIKFIAGRIAMRLPPHLSTDDLISAGALGLIDAVDKYDPDRNAQFKTYAEYRIRGAILDELRAMDWVPRSVRHKSQRVDNAFQELAVKLGREPEDEDMARHLGLSLEEYHDLLSATAAVGLLAIVETEEGLARFIPGTMAENTIRDASDGPIENLDKNEIKKVIAAAIGRLPHREQLVVSLYYYDELTMKEIGKVLNYTESRICQIHSQVMTKLRVRLRDYFSELT